MERQAYIDPSSGQNCRSGFDTLCLMLHIHGQVPLLNQVFTLIVQLEQLLMMGDTNLLLLRDGVKWVMLTRTESARGTLLSNCGIVLAVALLSLVGMRLAP